MRKLICFIYSSYEGCQLHSQHSLTPIFFPGHSRKPYMKACVLWPLVNTPQSWLAANIQCSHNISPGWEMRLDLSCSRCLLWWVAVARSSFDPGCTIRMESCTHRTRGRAGHTLVHSADRPWQSIGRWWIPLVRWSLVHVESELGAPVHWIAAGHHGLLLQLLLLLLLLLQPGQLLESLLRRARLGDA